MSIKPLIHTLLAGLLILTGCQGLPTTPFAEKSSTQTLSQTVQTSKGPYTGPLNLKINTGLIAGTSGKMIDLLPQGQGFQTQALPQGPIVFSETLILSRKDQDFSRSFKIPDTSKRYLVHIAKQEPQRGREGRVQVNLNGAWVIREKDFERGEEEFQTTGLLLNANNALKIRFKGKVGSRLTVTVVEAGEAGTILRRRGWEKDRDLTQADRIRNNDSNIFDPNDPDSLGGLEPYEGDEPTQNPSNPQRIGLALANQTQARIAVGEVRVLMREPVAANLQALQARFPVLVRETEESFGDTFATLQVKFEEVDLGELANHIQILNQRPDILSLREVIFSSVNTAKTISAALEIQSQAQDLVQGANLVTLGEKHSTVDFDEQNTPLTNETPTKTPPTLPVKASSLWWLESIKAREAWDYSLGEGATVAMVDQEYGYIQDNPEFGHIDNNPGVKKRILLSNGVSYLKQGCATTANGTVTVDVCLPLNDQTARPGTNRLFNEPGHGLATASFLAAGQDNKNGIVGVAPGATILPMYSSGGIETTITKQLERLYHENVPVDVVSISMGRTFNAFDLMMGSLNYLDTFFRDIIRDQTGINLPPAILEDVSNMDIRRLIQIIGKLTREKNVVFVTSGGNSGWGYNPSTADKTTELNFPSCLPFVIGVGAYEDVGGTYKRAKFKTFPLEPAKKITDPGSDYGPQLTIWAPGTNLWVQNQRFENNDYQPTWKYWEGTSHATPLVAGTVALMKSINKNLTYGDVYFILQGKGFTLSDSSFIPQGKTPYPVHGLNAQGALQDSRVGGTTAKTYTFKVQNDGLEDIANKVPGNGRVATFRASNFAQFKALYPVLEVGQTIEMTGWTQNERSTIPANQIHVQKLQKVISASGFQIQSLLPPPTGADPAAFGVKAFYNPNNPTPITARAGDVIGFFTANARTRNISIEIQGKNAVLTANHDDLLSMTVPADLIVGNLDATFKSAEGEFKIENLIHYTSPFPEVVKWSKPTIFANGGDVVDGYISVKDANGQPAPDGTPYYVQLVPTQIGLYPDLTMIHPETGQQYGGRWTTVEQVLPVKNDQIHIQAKLNAAIAPFEYTYDFANNLPNIFTWPHAQAPSVQVQVCNPAYSSSKPGYGYYCGQQLFPQAGNTLDGRLYALHAYSFNPQIHHVTAGSPKRTFTIGNIQDILGNPVPVGTVLYFNQTYYGNVSNPNGNDIYWGVAVTTPGQVEIAYEPFQRIYCGLVGTEEPIYMTSVQGAASSSLHWLVGNPIYFRYVAC